MREGGTGDAGAADNQIGEDIFRQNIRRLCARALPTCRLAREPYSSGTMVRDEDIWLLSAALLRKHGEDAAEEVHRRLRRAEEEGDDEGHAVWLAVAGAILELEREPTADDNVN
jgi:hypothetical protein